MITSIKEWKEYIKESVDRLGELKKYLTRTDRTLFTMLTKVEGIEPLLKKLGLENKTEDTVTDDEIALLAKKVDNPTWYPKLPATYFFQGHPKRLPPDTLLIHFTHKPQGIIKNGFTQGTPDMQRLGMSWGRKNNQPGWNYAFTIKDVINKYGSIKDAQAQWGGIPIVFNAPGIRDFHFGDNEYQVIFWGADAKNIRILKDYSLPIKESVRSISELLPEDVYFLRKGNEFCLTTKSKVLAYANLLPKEDYLIFDKIQGPGYGMIMHALVLMSIYPKMARPSHSSKPQVIKLWLNLRIRSDIRLLSQPVTKKNLWANYDSSVNPKETDNLEVVNKLYSMEPTVNYNELIDKSNAFVEKMSQLVPGYVEKRLNVGRQQYTEEYV